MIFTPPTTQQLQSSGLSIARGAGLGAVLGAAYHTFAGPTKMVIGQPELKRKLVSM